MVSVSYMVFQILTFIAYDNNYFRNIQVRKYSEGSINEFSPLIESIHLVLFLYILRVDAPFQLLK